MGGHNLLALLAFFPSVISSFCTQHKGRARPTPPPPGPSPRSATAFLLCFVRGQGQKGEQKHTAKKLVEFHNHSLLLTMLTVKISFFAKALSMDIAIYIMKEQAGKHFSPEYLNILHLS